MRKKKIYFASDFHLGIPDYASSLEREKKIVRWLESIKGDAEKIYLVGDLFDFWFEYKDVVPKGHTRLFGKLAELKDAGIEIEIFTGNHDLWMFGYFETEFNIPVHHKPIQIQLNGKEFFIGHGDGIGPGDRGYKWMKKLFTSTFCQRAFAILHPYLAFRIAHYFSHNSRLMNEEEIFLGEEKEWQILFAKEMLKKKHIDFFIFGHRHIVLNISIGSKTQFINLGDWITHFSYVVFDGDKTEIKYFEN